MSVLLNPYITFKDNARDALEFYQSVFGGELNVMTFRDMPAMETEPAEANKLMHGQLNGDNGIVLMASDTPNSTEYTPYTGSISLSGDDETTLTGYYEKLSAGGQIGEPLMKAPWGDTFGMCTDKFGVHWMVNIAGSPAG